MKLLVNEGADTNLSNSTYGNPLVVTTGSNNMDKEYIELLINNGASDRRSIQNNSPYSPLYQTLLFNRPDVAKIILQNEVDPNYVDVSGQACRSTLMEAIRLGDIEIIRELIRRGADPIIRTKMCQNISYFLNELEYLAFSMKELYSEEEAFEIVNFLINAGLNINEKHNTRFMDILEASIISNYTTVMNSIIDAGFDLNSKNKSPLLKLNGDYLGCALSIENCAAAETLIQNGVNLNTYDKGSHHSIFTDSHQCKNLPGLILTRITNVQKNIENMTVDLGDELVYNFYPELGNQVVVMNWENSE